MKFIGKKQKKKKSSTRTHDVVDWNDSTIPYTQCTVCKYIYTAAHRDCVSSFASFAFISPNDSSRIYRYYSVTLVHADVTNFGVAQNTFVLQTKDLPPIKWFRYFNRCRNRLIPLRVCALWTIACVCELVCIYIHYRKFTRCLRVSQAKLIPPQIYMHVLCLVYFISLATWTICVYCGVQR